MIELTSFDGHKKQVEVCSISGKVIDVRRTVKTHISGRSHALAGGKNRYAHAGTSIKSSNTTHDEVYIVNEAGKEEVLRLTNFEEANIRAGHHVQALYFKGFSPKGDPTTTPYILINNRSLDKVVKKYDEIIEPLFKTGLIGLMKLQFNQISSSVVFVALVIIPLIIALFTALIFTPVFAAGYLIWWMYASRNINKQAEELFGEIDLQIKQYLLPPT
ncbi:hypothetical protein B0181_06910 [Moraxella caviae]|uniref:Uncharacterized protein n=1 Tax=Moraxella caviae TaxID=34060 RepID=A0A1T0A0X5_9GAMM|nr:hypothetical protein [Moraxella caviae]OOR89404.1 hypothetical protein B0181_06910 [Moraxella caviae]STZ09873.1 Uncharacterised protein [Moraxella caviae]VEW11455.1 Uncharacterised protein [Moraxella caviae]VEW12923.1 Uncharacterised protein [Moraxella caviae]